MVNPYSRLSIGRRAARDVVGMRVEEWRRKRRPICNGLDRGSNFAPPERGADIMPLWYFRRGAEMVKKVQQLVRRCSVDIEMAKATIGAASRSLSKNAQP